MIDPTMREAIIKGFELGVRRGRSELADTDALIAEFRGLAESVGGA